MSMYGSTAGEKDALERGDTCPHRKGPIRSHTGARAALPAGVMILMSCMSVAPARSHPGLDASVAGHGGGRTPISHSGGLELHPAIPELPPPGGAVSMAEYLASIDGRVHVAFACSPDVLQDRPTSVWHPGDNARAFAMRWGEPHHAVAALTGEWVTLSPAARRPAPGLERERQFWVSDTRLLEFAETFSPEQIRRMRDLSGLLPMMELSDIQRQMLWELDGTTGVRWPDPRLPDPEAKISLCRTASLCLRANQRDYLPWLGIFDYTAVGLETSADHTFAPTGRIGIPSLAGNGPEAGPATTMDGGRLGATVRLSGAGQLSAGALARQVSEQTGVRVFVDRRWAAERLFVSRRQATGRQWIAVIESVLQLQERRVTDIIFLTGTSVPVEKMGLRAQQAAMRKAYPEMMARADDLRTRVATRLTQIPFDGRHLPFSESEFQRGTLAPVRNLTEDQRQWLEAVARTHPARTDEYERADLSDCDVWLSDTIWLEIVQDNTAFMVQML